MLRADASSEAGVMLARDGLHPSTTGKRVKLAGGRFTVIDSPFTASKELVASYALFQVATMHEAVHWTRRFFQVLGTGECELRPIFDAEDFSQEVFTPEVRKHEEAARTNMKRSAARTDRLSLRDCARALRTDDERAVGDEQQTGKDR